jgi:type IV secretory pathway VirB2 component (pilin)
LKALRRRARTSVAKSCGSVTEVGRQVATVLYVVAMVAIIVGVDFAFFKNQFWERLIVNIGIVLVFAAFYLRFLRRP